MFKRSQRQVADSSKHWYQDKYQHVLVQRNMLALLALVALLVALIAVFTVARLAPLKSVEPYLLQVDEKTGITQKVEPVSRNQIVANEMIDRFFVGTYVRVRETYNPTIRLYNDNVVRVMSTQPVFSQYRKETAPSTEGSPAAKLGMAGQRQVRIKTMNYISPPVQIGRDAVQTPEKIMRVRFSTTDITPNAGDVTQHWEATVTFMYALIDLNQEEQLLNPIGFTVLNYQIQRELN